jgi:hypothetical protein
LLVLTLLELLEYKWSFSEVAVVDVYNVIVVAEVSCVGVVNSVAAKDVVVASVVGVGVVDGKNWKISTGSQSVRFCILSMCRSS